VFVWRPPAAQWARPGFGDGGPGCAPDRDYYDRATAMLNEWITRFGWGTPIQDADVSSMEAAVTQEEMKDFGQEIAEVNKAIQIRRYGRGDSSLHIDDLCLIPKDELVSAVVDYDGAVAKVRSGQMRRADLDKYTIEMKGPDHRQDKKVTKEEVTLAGEKEPTWVYIYKDPYDPKVGIGHKDLP